MTIQTTADQAVQSIAMDMQLLREFPGHCQAEEWRQTLERVRIAAPDLYAEAAMAAAEPAKEAS